MMMMMMMMTMMMIHLIPFYTINQSINQNTFA